MSSTATLAMSAGNSVLFPANSTNAVFGDQPPNGVARVQVTGNFSGQAIFEETLDNLNWFASPFAFADAAPVAGVPIIGAAGTFTVKMPGSVALRVRCTLAGSGSAVIFVAIIEGSDVGLSPFATAAQFSGTINAPAVFSTTVNQTVVPASITSVPLLGTNSGRKQFSVLNDAPAATLYLSLGATATLASPLQAGPNAMYTPPVNFTGPVYGIWDIATGNARMMEFV